MWIKPVLLRNYMLEHFFSMEGDKSIFDGLEIAKETALCREYMGKYPVVFVSLKGRDALSYEMAFQMGFLDSDMKEAVF